MKNKITTAAIIGVAYGNLKTFTDDCSSKIAVGSHPRETIPTTHMYSKIVIAPRV